MSFLTTKCHFRSCMSFLITKAGTTVRCIRHLSCMSFLTTKDSMIFSVLGNAGRVAFFEKKRSCWLLGTGIKDLLGEEFTTCGFVREHFFFTSTIYPKICIVFSRFFKMWNTSDSICVGHIYLIRDVRWNESYEMTVKAYLGETHCIHIGFMSSTLNWYDVNVTQNVAEHLDSPSTSEQHMSQWLLNKTTHSCRLQVG